METGIKAGQSEVGKTSQKMERNWVRRGGQELSRRSPWNAGGEVGQGHSPVVGRRGEGRSHLRGYILGSGVGPGLRQGTQRGMAPSRSGGPLLSSMGGHCPWARLKRTCWESGTHLLPARLRFSPAAGTCPKGSQSVPGLGSKGSKAPHLPTDGLYPQGKAPALLSGPPQLLHPIFTLLPPLGSPALIAASHSEEMDW